MTDGSCTVSANNVAINCLLAAILWYELSKEHLILTRYVCDHQETSERVLCPNKSNCKYVGWRL